jgi:hypothetical protein
MSRQTIRARHWCAHPLLSRCSVPARAGLKVLQVFKSAVSAYLLAPAPCSVDRPAYTRCLSAAVAGAGMSAKDPWGLAGARSRRETSSPSLERPSSSSRSDSYSAQAAQAAASARHARRDSRTADRASRDDLGGGGSATETNPFLAAGGLASFQPDAYQSPQAQPRKEPSPPTTAPSRHKFNSATATGGSTAGEQPADAAPTTNQSRHGRKDSFHDTSGSKLQATSLQAYSSEAAVDAFLSNLASELSMIAEQPAAIFKSHEVDSVESLSQALEVLHTTLATLSDVQSRATRHVSFLSVRGRGLLCYAGTCWRSECHCSVCVRMHTSACRRSAWRRSLPHARAVAAAQALISSTHAGGDGLARGPVRVDARRDGGSDGPQRRRFSGHGCGYERPRRERDDDRRAPRGRAPRQHERAQHPHDAAGGHSSLLDRAFLLAPMRTCAHVCVRLCWPAALSASTVRQPLSE